MKTKKQKQICLSIVAQTQTFIRLFIGVFLLFLILSALATIGLGLFIDGSYFLSIDWMMTVLALSFFAALVAAVVNIFSPLI